MKPFPTHSQHLHIMGDFSFPLQVGTGSACSSAATQEQRAPGPQLELLLPPSGLLDSSMLGHTLPPSF